MIDGRQSTPTGIDLSGRNSEQPVQLGIPQLFLVLLALNFVANYLLMDRFGVYEDDYHFIVPPLEWSAGDWWRAMVQYMTTWPQGRPIWWVLTGSFGYVIGLSGSLQTGYLFGLLVSTFTALALQRFLRAYASELGATIAAMFYIVFPVDTSEVLLMHYMHFQITLLLLLLALVLYRSRRAAWSYLVLFVSLITYEPYFLIFLLAPFLLTGLVWRDRLIRLVVHGAVCTGIFVAVMGIRLALGDGRTAQVAGNFEVFLKNAVTAPIYGLATGLITIMSRVGETLVDLTPVGFVWVVLWTAGISLFLRLLRSDGPYQPAGSGRNDYQAMAYFFLLGLAMAAIAYVYRFYPWYFPPIHTSGRLSHVHQPSALGYCLMLAVGVDWVAAILGARRTARRLAGVLAALILALLVVFGIRVQQESYVDEWEASLQYWTDLIDVTADLDADTPVVVDLRTIPNPEAGRRLPGARTPWWRQWDIKTLARLEERDSPDAPETRAVWHLSEMIPSHPGVRLRVFEEEGEKDLELRDGGFALVSYDGGRWVRSDKAFVIGAHSVLPLPFDENKARVYRKSRTYEILIGDCPHGEMLTGLKGGEYRRKGGQIYHKQILKRQ